MSQKITPSNITKLKRNEVFVFGSNLNGNHAGGAAKFALDNFGAINGQGIGLQGKSYALPTLTESMEKIDLNLLEQEVNVFLNITIANPKTTFYVTEIGCGIAGFKIEEIAPLFKEALGGTNIALPQSFVDVLVAPIITTGFKGYEKDLKCRDHQYEIGKTYKLDVEPKACEKGFHFCEHPLDVFNYYPPATSRYTEVKGEGTPARHAGGDSKVAVSTIHIGDEITLASLTKAAVKFVFDRAKYSKQPTENATGYQGAASATGYQGAASATGYQGAASATGTRGAASATGYQGAAVSLGAFGKAKAEKGAWITISEWEQDENWNWNRIDVQTKRVDGETIKANTYYKLEGGNFIEA